MENNKDFCKKRIAVIGSRSFNYKDYIFSLLTKNLNKINSIVSGGASGPDSYAVEWAIKYGIPYTVYPALWHDPETGKLDRGAGFKRNQKIIEDCDLVVAFYDGSSKGTAHSISIAQRLNKPLKIFRPPSI